jgi:hypothetical protein
LGVWTVGSGGGWLGGWSVWVGFLCLPLACAVWALSVV